MLIFASRRFSVLTVATLLLAGAAAFTAVTPLTAQQQGTPKQLIVAMRVTDKKDVPLTDIQASELEVKENGKSVPVQGVELDKRPLVLALVLDNNTELSTSFMQSVVPAGVALVKALPEGTTIEIWTSG